MEELERLQMHSFAELIDRSARFTLNALNETEIEITDALQTTAATHLVKNLQMIQLQKVIMAVGMFSIFESILQDRLSCRDGFMEARKYLEREGEAKLKDRFSQFTNAINVLKHGRGRSYNALLAEEGNLPFRIKRPDESFFSEGDVAEVSTLIEVDDRFVLECANLIRNVSNVIDRVRPGVL